MMKTTLALVATLATATASYAGDLGFNAKAEYGVEADSFELAAGANYGMGGIDLFTEGTFITEGTTDIAFDGLDIGAGYALTASTEVYGIIELDDNLEYGEAVIGVAVSF